VAWQKLTALLESEAVVRVVAPEALNEVEALARAQKVEWVRRPFQSSDMEQMSLVIAATDDPELQRRVAAEARARGIWVNVVTCLRSAILSRRRSSRGEMSRSPFRQEGQVRPWPNLFARSWKGPSARIRPAR